MVRLASCYFCGAADEALEEYPIVPPALSPDGDGTVVLCPSCHRKRAALLERIAGAVDAAGDSADDPPDVASAAGDAAGSDARQAATGPTAESPTDARPSAESPADADPTGDSPTDDVGPDAGPAGDGPADTPDVPVETFNKVIRLLQNREFPVARAEIEAVAASAYDVAESDCAAAIDAAIDRGLLAEVDGELVRPED